MSRMIHDNRILYRVCQAGILCRVLGLGLLLSLPVSAAEPSAAVAPKSLDQAAALNQQVIELYQAGEYERALSQSKKVLELLEDPRAGKSPELASALSNQAMILKALGKLQEAAKQLTRALELVRAAGSPGESQLASILMSLASVQLAQGSLVDAEHTYRRALAITEQSLGPEHPEAAPILTGLGDALRQQGKYADAEKTLRRALALQEQRLGADAPGVAQALNNLAALLAEQGKLAEAEPLFLRTLLLRKKALGESHPAVAASLNNLAVLYEEKGDYLKAEQYYVQTLAIVKQRLGPEHPQTAVSLNNLASALLQQSRAQEAEPLLRRALAIQESALGPSHVAIAASLSNLSRVYQSQGKYSEAEVLLRRALSIYRSALGPEHPDVAAALSNQAALLIDEGRYSAALPLLEQALQIYQKAFGIEHTETAAVLGNMAQAYQAMGRLSQAEDLLRRVLSILERTLGKKHLKFTTTLLDLAKIHLMTGNLDRAEALLAETRHIQESIFGKMHPTVARTLGMIADLRMAQRNYSGAELLVRTALAIQEKAFSREHPDVASNLVRLSAIELAQKQCEQSAATLERALEIRERILDDTQSEARMSSLLKAQRAEEELAYALSYQCSDSLNARRLALAVALLRKGRAAEEGWQQQQRLRRALKSPEAQLQLAQFRRLKAQRANLLWAGPGLTDVASYTADIRKLEAEAEVQERQLSAAYALPYHARRFAANRIIGEVAAKLPKDGVLIEVVSLSSPTATFNLSGGKPDRAKRRYLALMLSSDEQMHALDLGDAQSIDHQVALLIDKLSNPLSDPLPSARALYASVFAPLEQLLTGQNKLFLSLDGELLRVPFAALSSGTDYLSDRYQFIYLTSGRDLLRTPAQHHGSNIYVFADPDFSSRASTALGSVGIGEPSQPRKLPMTNFQRLPGTRMEAMEIRRLFPSAQVYLGAEATEAALHKMTAPAIVHLATHGLFLDQKSRQVEPETRGAVLVEPQEVPRMLEDGGILSRSALLLAGAGAAVGQLEYDGILTAEEAAMLNLEGTELVVLSACESGRGDISIGEGVYGLRRAFSIAGAENVVSSLWRVSDSVTGELMSEFYRRLSTHRGPVQAMAQAARSVRARYPHPYYWASFLVSGLDTPLSPELRIRSSP